MIFTYDKNENLFHLPQHRFNSFYYCKKKLKYQIKDYVKSGFFFQIPHCLICHNCKLKIYLHTKLDPCLFHQHTDCPYKNAIVSHKYDNIPELILLWSVISIVIIVIIIIMYMYFFFTCN